MNDLVTNVKSLELETLQNLKSSKALNTLRAYKADYKDFSKSYFSGSTKHQLDRLYPSGLVRTYTASSQQISGSVNI